MKTINLGENYTHRVTLRLNDRQHSFLLEVSNMLGVSPSDYLRMCVNAGMANFKKEMVGTDANVKTNSDNKL